MNINPNDAADGAASDVTPTPSPLDGNFAVPGNRSAVLEALARRRRDLKEEVDDPTNVADGTVDQAAKLLIGAADHLERLDAEPETKIEPVETNDLNAQPDDASEDAPDDEPVSDSTRQSETERKESPTPTPSVELKPGTMVKVNIGGQIRELPAEQVAAAIGAANVNNDRIGRIENEIAAMRSPATRQGESPATDATAPAGNQGDGGDQGAIVSDAELEKYQTAIQFGSDQDARAALRELVSTAVTAATRQAVGAALAETTDVRRREALTETVKALGTEFRDVMEDDGLRLLAVESVFKKRAKQLIDAGHNPQVVNECLRTADGRAAIIKAGQIEAERGRVPTHEKVFREALADTRKRYGRRPSQNAPGNGTETTTSDRKAAKRQIVAPPPTASSARAAMPADDSPRAPSASDIVKNMRKNRGQLVA